MAHPPSPATIDGTLQELNHTFELLGQVMVVCEFQYDRIVQQAGDVLSLGGPLAVWMVSDNLDRLGEAVRKGLDIGRKVLQHGTPVLSLFKVSIDYLDAVQAPVSGMSGLVAEPRDDNLAYWSGKAADRYKVKQAVQQKAVDGAAGNAAAVSEWLYKIGQYNVDYAVRIMQSLTEAALKMVKVAVNAVGVVSIPFALDDLAEAITALINVCAQELLELANRFADVVGDVRTLTAERSANGPFPDGGWPQAVHVVPVQGLARIRLGG